LTVLLEYLTQILDAMKQLKHVIDCNFIFQQYSALMLIALNTVQLLQCKTHLFLSGQWPENHPELNSITTRLGNHTAATA